MTVQANLLIVKGFEMITNFWLYSGWRSWNAADQTKYIDNYSETWYPTGTTAPLSSYNPSVMKGTNLIKVIECPYAPFDLNYDDNGALYIPSG